MESGCRRFRRDRPRTTRSPGRSASTATSCHVHSASPRRASPESPRPAPPRKARCRIEVARTECGTPPSSRWNRPTSRPPTLRPSSGPRPCCHRTRAHPSARHADSPRIGKRCGDPGKSRPSRATSPSKCRWHHDALAARRLNPDVRRTSARRHRARRRRRELELRLDQLASLQPWGSSE